MRRGINTSTPCGQRSLYYQLKFLPHAASPFSSLGELRRLFGAGLLRSGAKQAAHRDFHSWRTGLQLGIYQP